MPLDLLHGIRTQGHRQKPPAHQHPPAQHPHRPPRPPDHLDLRGLHLLGLVVLHPGGPGVRGTYGGGVHGPPQLEHQAEGGDHRGPLDGVEEGLLPGVLVEAAAEGLHLPASLQYHIDPPIMLLLPCLDRVQPHVRSCLAQLRGLLVVANEVVAGQVPRADRSGERDTLSLVGGGVQVVLLTLALPPQQRGIQQPALLAPEPIPVLRQRPHELRLLPPF
mmetsp:Transcript_80683/g.215376  ORF Transcript_80683/g.215376 Transcript_80683/m.215376 type:complete len:219 (+) Transcript_80683:581-1237(+)